MYCGHCGAANPDGSAFCKQCGAKLASTKLVTTSNSSQKRVAAKSSNQNRTVGIIAVAAVAVIVLVLGILLFGGRSYKSTVKQYINATFDGNAKKIVQLIPKKVVNTAIDDYFDDRDELIEEMDESLEYALDWFDTLYGEDWRVSYKIIDADDITGKSLKSVKDEYEDEYDVKVTAAMKVEVELTIKYDGDETTQTMNIRLIKVGSSWYIDVENMSLF